MLIIKPIQDKQIQAEYCAACDVPFCAKAMAYEAKVDGILVGICQFTMNDTVGTVLHLSKAIGTDDTEAMFIMARQTLNFIDLCGVHLAKYEFPKEKEADEKWLHLIKWIGFRQKDDGWFMDLTDFFHEPCQHSPKADETYH